MTVRIMPFLTDCYRHVQNGNTLIFNGEARKKGASERPPLPPIRPSDPKVAGSIPAGLNYFDVESYRLAGRSQEMTL
jgi:hypothetical protein